LNAIEASATREGEVSSDGPESDVIFNPIKGGDQADEDQTMGQ